MKSIWLYAKTSFCALLAATLIVVPVGCTQASVDNALNKIAAEIPVAVNAAEVVAPVVSAIDPATIPVTTAALAIIVPGLSELQTLITQYTTNPNASVLAKIESLINSLVSNGSNALYEAAHITDAATQQKISAVLSALSAILVVIDGFIQQIEPAAVIAHNAASRAVKLSVVYPNMNHSILDRAAQANGVTTSQFLSYETAHGY